MNEYEVDSGHTPQIQGEHRAILEACKHGDAEQAANIMRDHVAQVGRTIVEYIRRRNESQDSASGTE